MDSFQNPFASSHHNSTADDPFADPSISNVINQSNYVALDDGKISIEMQPPTIPLQSTSSAFASSATLTTPSNTSDELKEKEEELRRKVIFMKSYDSAFYFVSVINRAL